MRAPIRWSVLLLAAGLAACAAPRADVVYLGPTPNQPAAACPNTELDDLEINWFSGMWRAGHEPSLYEQSMVAGAPTSYRFTWLRTFHAPVFVRLDEGADGRLHMMAKKLSGAGGYEPGHTIASVQRTLTDEETARVRQMLARLDVATQPSGDCAMGMDGAQWIWEVSRGGKYYFVNRWTPGDGPVHDGGMLLLSFTGWNLEPVY